jgi:hypothetical protein
MPRPIAVTVEFTFDMEQDGFSLASVDCRATADVRSGEPARPYQDDPGSGPEVEGFRDIEVEGTRYDMARPAGERSQRRWFKPHDTLRDWILAYLESGAVDGQFEDAADNAGGYADHRSAMA